MAQQKIETDSMIVCISSLPTQSKAVLYSMLLLGDMNRQLFTTGEVAQVYRDVAHALDLDVLTHRRIADLISELTMLGVINSRVVSRGRYGRTKEMWFSTGSGGIKETIFKDDRFVEEDLAKIDLNRYRALLR